MPDNAEIAPTRLERLILLNQYRLMAMIEPDSPEHKKAVEALTDGHALPIQALAEWVLDGLNDVDCRFVIHTMAMYDALQRSYKALPAGQKTIKSSEVSFRGFDGNNETEFMSYARFVVEYEGRFTYLLPQNNDFNSHMPTVNRYRSQLTIWQEHLDESYELTAEQMRRILDAR